MIHGVEVAERESAARRLTRSVRTTENYAMPSKHVLSWLEDRAAAHDIQVRRVPLSELTGWRFEPGSGNVVHETGRFFSVEGLRVLTDREWIPSWSQPIIVQPEVGILGILTKEVDGVLHCLMHAKAEPGNVNGVQLSPTVQATHSNYTGVHCGAAVPYLEYFRHSGLGRVLVDVQQSEQGSWFFHKRNRNIVVETTEKVPLLDDYCWLTLGQISELLRWPDVVNMDTRTVLSCLPTTAGTDGWGPRTGYRRQSSLSDHVRQSFESERDARHSSGEILSWLTEQRSRRLMIQRRVPLAEVLGRDWMRTEEAIAHRDGRYFSVIGVAVSTRGREVGSWRQPLFAPAGPGLLALLTRCIRGVLHVLAQARLEAGCPRVVDLAPTVHCQPDNYRGLAPRAQPPFLDYALSIGRERILYDVVQSEEGGRFFHARNRYLVVEADEDFPLETPSEYCWMTLGQLSRLLIHSNYLNVELRSLLACMRGWG